MVALVLFLTLQLVHSQLINNHERLAEWVVHVPNGLEAAKLVAAENDLDLLGEVIPDSNEYHVRPFKNYRRKRSALGHHHIEKRIMSHKDVAWAEQQTVKRRIKRDIFSSSDHPKISFNDPYWSKMWYLNRDDGYDMNVQDAWEQGVSGQGVSVTILDDGVEKDHPDLLQNYDPLASTDINDNDSDPQPRYDFNDSNGHGTRCAGQVAASSNNSICAVGIAFNARIGGIRMLDGTVSDAVEARSLSFNPDHVDIYSSSWGPNDDGKTVDGPGRLASRALLNGITRGRDGKGSIFVWASGNGGRYKDNCNCDGYTTSIYTITVSSTSESGKIPWYSEPCSSTLATTYSSGTASERKIVTTDLHSSCTVKHTGTSASAPMAAAIIALALEANPQLTWRDVQHIIVKTARPVNLKAYDWKVNGLGRKVSNSYGYGLMDAGAMVRTAKEWINVPKQESCEITTPYHYKSIAALGYITIDLEVRRSDCPNLHLLEHVVAKVYVSAGKWRGELRITMESPRGTRSVLLDLRPHDYNDKGFFDWPFMSVHNWGEDPIGVWRLTIFNEATSKWSIDAKFVKWSLLLHGIQVDPNNEEYKEQLRAEEEEKERLAKLKERQLRRHAMWPQNVTGLNKETRPRINIQELETDSNKKKEGHQSGCISKRLECTQAIGKCRTFSHRKVAQLFCKCSHLCNEIASVLDPTTGKSAFNMQCTHNEQNQLPEPNSKSVEIPLYCAFIPFFSYR